MRALKYLIINFILTFAILCQGAPKDIVFDLDWTLFYQTDASKKDFDPSRTTQFKGHGYHLTESAEEVLEYLQSKGLRISFFSGGDPERNHHLIQFIKNKFKEKSGQDLKIFKVLNFDDLTRTSAPENAKFADRYKKDLSKVNPDFTQVYIFDDLKNFIPENQKKQMIWLGKTFNYLPQFPKKPSADFLADEYNPKSESDWYLEKNKLIRALEIFTYLAANKTVPENDLFLIESGKMRIKNSIRLSCKKILN